MDREKDTTQGRYVGQIFDDAGKTRANPFGDNVAGDRLYRRTERIVAGIHLLTNHIPADEPLRTAVRTAGLTLLASALDLRDGLRTPDAPQVRSFQSVARQIISLVSTLAVAGLASRQNVAVISEALDELAGLLTMSQRTPLTDSTRLSKSDLTDVPSPTIMTDRQGKIIKDTRPIKDTVQKDSDVLYKKTSDTTARATAIVSVLRDDGADMSIRDIAAHLPEYGDKMIQRELGSLVAAGRVRRVGTKRWSRYSLLTSTDGGSIVSS